MTRDQKTTVASSCDSCNTTNFTILIQFSQADKYLQFHPPTIICLMGRVAQVNHLVTPPLLRTYDCTSAPRHTETAANRRGGYY